MSTFLAFLYILSYVLIAIFIYVLDKIFIETRNTVQEIRANFKNIDLSKNIIANIFQYKDIVGNVLL